MRKKFKKGNFEEYIEKKMQKYEIAIAECCEMEYNFFE